MMEISDQNLEYALCAIQDPQLRETEEFHKWIGLPRKQGTLSLLNGLQRSHDA